MTRGVLIGLAVLAVGLGIYLRVNPKRPDRVACADPVEVHVVSSTEKADALRTLAGKYNAQVRTPGEPCGEIAVYSVSSGIAEQLLADPEHMDPAISQNDKDAVRIAHVWLPSSAIWLEQLDLDTKKSSHQGTLQSIASSPLVLAMPEQTAARAPLNWLEKPPTWRQAMDALRNGDVHYTQENPRTSTSGALATFLTYAAAAADNGALAPDTVEKKDLPSLSDFVRQVQAATKSGFLNDSVAILRKWSPKGSMPGDTMIMIQEQMVYGFNHGMYSRYQQPGHQAGQPPATPLVAIYPVSPSGAAESIMADHPYVILDRADTDEKRIAGDFLDFIFENWNVLCDAGFRPPVDVGEVHCDGPSPERTAAGAPIRSGSVDSLPLPDSMVRSEMVEQWLNLRPKRRITIAMDVSGSMKDDELAKATTAVIDSVNRMRKTDQVEIYQFAGSDSLQNPYWQIRPLEDVGSPWKGDALRGAVPESSNTQRSSLYTTVTALYDQVAERQAEGRKDTLDVLIVLSDGVDDWKKSGASADSVCAHFKASKVKVPVHTIHYDAGIYDAERQRKGVETLEKLATCNGIPGLAQDGNDDGGGAMPKIFSQVLGSV